MKAVRPLIFAIVTAVFGLAALLMAQPWLQRGDHFTTGERATLSAVVLLQNVKVLAIDQIADERAEKPSLAMTATLEVNTTDAHKLTLAQTVGSLSLAQTLKFKIEAIPFDPNARVGVIRGMARKEYRIPKQLPDFPDTRCAAVYATLCYDGDGTLLR